jgi:hypothetical protein
MMNSTGFVFFPVMLCQACAPWQVLVYQLAYEQAQHPQPYRSVYDRELFSIMN